MRHSQEDAGNESEGGRTRAVTQIWRQRTDDDGGDVSCSVFRRASDRRLNSS